MRQLQKYRDLKLSHMFWFERIEGKNDMLSQLLLYFISKNDNKAVLICITSLVVYCSAIDIIHRINIFWAFRETNKIKKGGMKKHLPKQVLLIKMK